MRTGKLLLAALTFSAASIYGHTTAAPEPPCILILGPGASWEYTFDNPGPDLDWTVESGGWQQGDAPFGNNSSGLFAYNTFWGVENSVDFTDDLWIRRTLDLSGFDLPAIQWDIGIDNGFTLFINGVPMAAENKEGEAHRWDYSYNFPATALNDGQNFIALALEDHGGGTAFDLQVGIYACEVPEGASAGAFLGFAFAGLVWFKKKSK